MRTRSIAPDERTSPWDGRHQTGLPSCHTVMHHPYRPPCAGLQSPGYVPNTAQRLLAEEVTRFVHGEEGLAQAIKATEVGGAYGARLRHGATLGSGTLWDDGSNGGRPWP